MIAGQRILRRHSSILAQLALAISAAGAAAEECGTSGLNDSVGPTAIGGQNWTVYYTNDDWLDCSEAGHYFSTTWANKIHPVVTFADGRHVGDWGFPLPWVNGDPELGIYVFDSSDSGTNNKDCITLDAPKYRCAADASIRWVISHEIFHGRQRRYTIDGGGTGDLFVGAWFSEGTARCLDDRYDAELDNIGPFIVDTNRLMGSDEEDLGPYRDLSLTQLSYRACLFWGYCCEQLGTTNFDPDRGVDFVKTLWENVTEDMLDGTSDSIASLKRTIDEESGRTLEQFFHDYATAILTREYDATTLPNASRYVFIDETPAGLNGGSKYDNMIRSATHNDSSLPEGGNGTVATWGQKLYELTLAAPLTSGRCDCVGARANANEDLGWSLVGVKPPSGSGLPERATVLSKQRGKNYARAFLNPPNSFMTRLGLVIVGLDAGSDFEYEFDRGPTTMQIVRPTSGQPGYPGPHATPGRFLVRVIVDGPAGLKPEGVGSLSVKGLVKEDFTVRVGGIDATVINAAYVGGEYWLVVNAPVQAADGAFDLQVSLCASSPTPTSGTSANSVVYGDFRVNHMLVVDRSGSMAYPDDGSGSKLDAAKNAATLYIDSVNDTDRLGVTWLSGNQAECDDDASTPVGLNTANGGQRTAARNAVTGLTPTGWTSIGDGLWRAQDEFDNFPLGVNDVKWMVLLSDGEENEARFWNSTINCGGSDLGDSAKSRIEPSDTKVNAIAFGPESNQELMETISTQTEGDYSYVDVTDSAKGLRANPLSMVSDLADTYMRHLEEADNLERLFFSAASLPGGVLTQVNVPVTEGGVDRGVFFVNWPPSAGAVTVELRNPSNVVITGAQATIYTTSTHKVYHVNGTLATGTWRVRITPTNPAEFITGLLGRQRNGVQLMGEVSSIRTSGSPTGLTYGRHEQGVPVLITGIVGDSRGPVRGAAVTGSVRRPDGTLACGTLRLLDDGSQDDGEADDGIYAALFTDTSQAGQNHGVVNDNPMNPNPGGVAGTYRVELTAIGASNTGETFRRGARMAFHVYVADRNDEDNDGMADTWEKYYGTTLGQDDSAKDIDNDGLAHVDEYKHGTNPFDQDSDGGGEADGSEVAAGRCPLDPKDDLLPCPEDVGVLTDTGDLDELVLQPLANLLWFPIHTSYEKMRIYRADELAPNNYQLITEQVIGSINDGTYLDDNLVNGRRYFYRFQAVGANGALSCISHTVQGVAHADAIPPIAWVAINNGDERTDSLSVLVSLDLSSDADKYRISNTPITGAEPLLNLPATPYLPWGLAATSPGKQAGVNVQYVNSVTGRESSVCTAKIVYDPSGDFDNDGSPNSTDPDNDNDGVGDANEVFTYHTNAFKADSDEDALSDGIEAPTTQCTHPRNPDTDGDGLLDGADASPAADFDGDYDVDLYDWRHFQSCFTGPGGGPLPSSCHCLDTDNDGDLDLVDFNAFAAGLVGPN